MNHHRFISKFRISGVVVRFSRCWPTHLHTSSSITYFFT